MYNYSMFQKNKIKNYKLIKANISFSPGETQLMDAL